MAGRRRGARGPGQRQLPLQPPPGTGLRRAGGEGPRAVVRPRVGPGGRRGPGRAAQCGEVDHHLPDLGGQAQDRRLPLHHPRTPSGGGADGGRFGLHRGRHPRTGGGCRRGQGPRSPVPSPHHPVTGPGGAGGAGSGHRRGPGRRSWPCSSTSWPATSPTCSTGRGWWWGPRRTWSGLGGTRRCTSPGGRRRRPTRPFAPDLVISAVTGAGIRALVGRLSQTGGRGPGRGTRGGVDHRDPPAPCPKGSPSSDWGTGSSGWWAGWPNGSWPSTT